MCECVYICSILHPYIDVCMHLYIYIYVCVHIIYYFISIYIYINILEIEHINIYLTYLKK